ncbi:MAG: hypothetical protein RIC55_20885 [Pirellulaceae bacterium]
MPVSLLDFAYLYATPALVAGVALFLLSRLPGEVVKRFAASVAFVAAIGVGYYLGELVDWEITAHWDWLYYALLPTVAIAPVLSAQGVSLVERVLLCCLSAAVAAWFLVPEARVLETSREVHLLAWAGGVALLAVVLQPLPERLPGLALPLVLSATLLTAAVVLFLGASLRFSQFAGVGAGAMLGMTLAAALDRSPGSMRGIGLPLTILVAGALLVGQVNSYSEVPLLSYALVPFAPALLWIGAASPWGRGGGWKQVLLVSLPPLVLLAIAVALAVIAEWPLTGEAY